MKTKEKDDSSEFIEEIIEEKPKMRRDPKKLLSKMILGKKTILKRKVTPPPQPHPLIEEPKINKRSDAEILVESIVKTYWISKWKEQVQILKYSKQGFNQKRGNFRSLCMKMNNAMKYHQYLYLAKLFDKMDNLPKKENIVHDNFYGKIKLVKNNNNNERNTNNSVNNLDVKKENKKNIDENDDDINDLVDIKINLPEIKEVEYKPINKGKEIVKNNTNKGMDIENNNNNTNK